MKSRAKVIAILLVPPLSVWGIHALFNYLFPRQELPAHMLYELALLLTAGILLGILAVRQLRKGYEAEELFRSVSVSSPIAISIIQDGEIKYVNPQFQKIIGYNEDELAGTEALRLVTPEDRNMVRDNAVRILKGGRAAVYEYRVLTKNGEIRWIMETLAPIRYDGRQATLASFVDITDRKKMEEQLLTADRLASIGELASGIAHELNNPLTSVIGFSELLLERDIPDDVKEDIKVIHGEAQRTAGVVRNLLTFARKHAPVKQPVDINNTLELILKLRAYEQKVNNIVVDTRFAPDLPEVMADGFQLQQVFLNVIINAEYFMTEAHRRGTLTITTERLGDIIRASFADDGPGIAKENLGRVFDPFFTTKEVGKGTGLGLSIAYGIITEHGGRIYAESESGQGATFVVELPLPTPDTEGTIQ